MESESKKYYKRIKQEIDKVFEETINEDGLLGEINDLKSIISDWNSALVKSDENQLLFNSLEQIEISFTNLLLGLYRSAFSSLRLSLEMVCSHIYFSANKLNYNEWVNDSFDINWALITCPDNGILSHRYANAFFKDLNKDSGKILEDVKFIYRELSEFVHGNYKTWEHSIPSIKRHNDLHVKYSSIVAKLKRIYCYLFVIRYLQEFTTDQVSKVEEHIISELNDIDVIRIALGGEK